MTIDTVNQLGREEFVEAFGRVFEGSPWVSERAWAGRPFASRAALLEAMRAQVEAATETEQLALLRAHPSLGTRARLTDASATEQQGAGLDRLAPAEFAHFERLNLQYSDRFGFPFLFAVKGSSKHDILRALEQRLGSPRSQEFAEALLQVYRIANFRLLNTLDQED